MKIARLKADKNHVLAYFWPNNVFELYRDNLYSNKMYMHSFLQVCSSIHYLAPIAVLT